ncbi:MAG: hypothetical protein M1544_00425 [Candidatus Marsarchaeota archaeon]|nr:hypothetical protein [Candidatus Marsarchaeota archaeon]MCL5101810.1 hypothetical protein [Candidatus Marsarchaeota archaeon]
MAIFNIFGKKDAASDLTKAIPYRISTELVPYKLYSDRKSQVSLFLKVKNATKEVLLTSVVLELPSQLGFDDMGMQKQKELRLGEVKPGEEREARLDIHNTMNADPGEYTIAITTISHYRDYGHVLNAVKKKTTVNVV